MLPQTIDEVIDYLSEIVQQCQKPGNRKGYFPAIYLQVTEEIRNKIGEGFFENNERMEKLDVVFANRYLEAYQNYNDQQHVSESWRIAFEASKSWSPLVLQHLFLGMNAHISFDLGIAAATVAPGNSIHELYTDFFRVNKVLASLIDKVQNNLSAIWPFLKPIDWFMGRSDESLASFSLEIARDAAWQMAVELASLQTQHEKIQYLGDRDLKVSKFGRKIEHPGFILNSIIGLIRLGETGTIANKVRKLSQFKK